MTRLIMKPTTMLSLAALAAGLVSGADPATPKPGILVNPAVDTIVPQVVDGAGWSTSFFLTNLEPSKTIFWRLTFYSDGGGPMTLPLAGIGNANVVFASLPPNWSVAVDTAGAAAGLQQGWATLATMDRSADLPGATMVTDRIGGVGIFRQRVSGRPDFEAVVPFSPVNENKLVMPFDNRNGFSTGIAWLNPDFGFPAPLEVIIRDASGNLLRQDMFTLLGGAKLVFSMPDRYPEANLRHGRIQLSTPARLFSALGLRFNPTGAFTSFHALSVAP